MIQIFIWLPKGRNVGHISLQIGKSGDQHGTYISWWPRNQLNLYKKASGAGQSLQDDVLCESRCADITIEFNQPNDGNGLDEVAIAEWWNTFVSKKHEYGLGGKNCSWAVIQALRAGGSDKYFPWYKLNVQRNIPLKNALLPVLATAIRLMILHGDVVASTHVVLGLNRYAKSFLGGLKPSGSLKLAAVAVADEFSSVWSPHDALTYCLVLQKNIGRVRSGKTLIGI